ncbi:MAG: hypothetical protein NTV30_07640 [Chloroflexi bacterium]|nr:hypothetical protein [Chloroflexota bacterium]
MSDSYKDAIVTIASAKDYNINHLQISHQIVMDLCEIKDLGKQKLVKTLIKKAHDSGIKEVVVWDHTLYNLKYYPDEFKTGPGGTINLDNPAFWEWFKNDYRKMLNLIPEVDGLVLTFIETGARAENQYSNLLKTNQEKLAAVVDEVANIVCREYGKKLYIRTFAYTDAEYSNIIGCIEHIKNQDIILMMKETPHDFFLTHPNDKYAGTINRPTIIEFDTGNEFNGQGVIANTWPEYILKRWGKYVKTPNIIGYVARTDRYGTTRLIGTPNEILLYSLKRFTEDTTLNAENIYDEFITRKYGAKSLDYVKPAFRLAFDIVTSALYTLGTNTCNHSSLNYDPYKSSYGRHVSGKWLTPPTVYIAHDVNMEFHYWKDVVEHISPARFKTKDGPILTEAPYVLDSLWVTDTESMNEQYLTYIMAEKRYGVTQAGKALAWISKGKHVLLPADYTNLYTLFERTLLTAQLHEATATAYWGYRIYARSEEYRTTWLKNTIHDALIQMRKISASIENFSNPTPIGQWNWYSDAKMSKEYEKWIISGWKDYKGVKFEY